MVAEATAAASGVIRSSWIVVLLPVVSAVLTLFFGRRTPGKGAVYGIAAMGAAFVMSLLILWHFVQGNGTYASQVNWFSVGPFHVEVGQYTISGRQAAGSAIRPSARWSSMICRRPACRSVDHVADQHVLRPAPIDQLLIRRFTTETLRRRTGREQTPTDAERPRSKTKTATTNGERSG